MTRAVLTFHSVDDSGSVLSFPTRAFHGLIGRLARAGTAVVEFADLLRREEGLTLTFDDGMQTVYRHALPILRDHGFPAHLFLTTGSVGGQMTWPSRRGGTESFAMLDWDQLGECVRGGIRVECHTVTHPDLRSLAPAAVVEECTGADDEIERRTGRRPRLFAFPFGRFDDRVRNTVAPRYAGCFTTRLGYLGRAVDLSRIPRLDSYYLQQPVWHERLLGAPTRGYVAARGLIRAVRGVT